jgi:hypothetical protein
MTFISFKDASSADKAALLGPDFKNIVVVEADLSSSPQMVKIVLDGQTFTLIGDPVEALRTFLAGRGEVLPTSH